MFPGLFHYICLLPVTERIKQMQNYIERDVIRSEFFDVDCVFSTPYISWSDYLLEPKELSQHI